MIFQKANMLRNQAFEGGPSIRLAYPILAGKGKNQKLAKTKRIDYEEIDKKSELRYTVKKPVLPPTDVVGPHGASSEEKALLTIHPLPLGCAPALPKRGILAFSRKPSAGLIALGSGWTHGPAPGIFSRFSIPVETAACGPFFLCRVQYEYLLLHEIHRIVQGVQLGSVC